jgi:multicomponent Na+:H+ antiporter subunit D
MPLVGFILLPIISGLSMYIKPHSWVKKVTLLIQMLLLFCSLNCLENLHTIPEVIENLSVYPLPVGMTLRLDRLSQVTLILNNGLFLLMTMFAYRENYMNKLFIFLFLSLQGMINGVFLANDFFNVYILIEVATVTVSILIMFKKDSRSMYDGMIYLLVNMAAMAFFLLGVGYLYKYFGVLDFTTIGEGLKTVTNPKPLMMPLALLLTGVSLKAALMPLFSWLPKAHSTASAPSIVSSILSGIFVKTGVYLFVRIQILFNPVVDLNGEFFWMGLITVVAGFTFAIAQKDIKLILAYHTISQIGLIMIGLNVGSIEGFYGAIYHIFNHGIFKSLLFLIAGLCVEMYSIRDITQMKGLWYHSKAISIALIVAILSITGAPFFSGGYSKYLIGHGYTGFGGATLFQLLSMGTMISFIKFFKMIFSKPDTYPLKKVTWNEEAVLLIMAFICTVSGIFGDQIIGEVVHYKAYFPIYKQVGKVASYLITYGFAFVTYKLAIENRSWTKYIMGIELSYNSISLSIVTFFFMTALYLNWVV